jgi:archaellum component FlaC
MNLKETLDQIKAEFSAIADKFKPMKFGSSTTSDGVVLMYEGEMLTQGAAVTLEDGSPAPDGDHILESGVTVTIMEGVVSGIKENETPEPASDFSEQFTAIESRISKYEEELAGAKQSISEIQESISKMLEIANKQMDAFTAFAAQTPEPAAKPISAKKVEKESNLLAFAQSLNSIKK